MTNTKDTTNEELKQFQCSVLMAEVKEKVQMLKEYGMSEAEIVAQLHTSQEPPQLIVSRNYRLFLGEERKEVHMEPLIRAVYLLFLKHPEGIIFKDLPDYRKELTDIYNKVRPWGLSDRSIHSIEDVTNPMLNSINEKCARIRRTFVTMLDSSVAEHYYIKGIRGGAKKIDLSRDKIVWEE
jgi:hypothetical protein